MGRGQNCPDETRGKVVQRSADETRLGADGGFYRRGRRRAAAYDPDNTQAAVLRYYEHLLTGLKIDPEVLEQYLPELRVVLTPADLELQLDAGGQQLLAFIPAKDEWKLDLVRFEDEPMLTFIGRGRLELACATDMSGTGIMVRDQLDVKLLSGHVNAVDQVQVELAGKSIVSSYSGSPKLVTNHEWALVEACEHAEVTVNDSFQVFLAGTSSATLNAASRGQMILMEDAQLQGFSGQSAADLKQAGWLRTDQELQLADGLTASYHEWLRRAPIRIN